MYDYILQCTINKTIGLPTLMDWLVSALMLCIQQSLITGTVKPVLNGHSKIDITKNLMTNGSLMKVGSIAECSPWSILQYF